MVRLGTAQQAITGLERTPECSEEAAFGPVTDWELVGDQARKADTREVRGRWQPIEGSSIPIEPPYGSTTIIRLLEAPASGDAWIAPTLNLFWKKVQASVNRCANAAAAPPAPAAVPSADQSPGTSASCSACGGA